MNTLEMEKKLRSQSYIEPEMIEAAFDFWFNDREHIRSPFPYYIREELRLNSTNKFLDWTLGLNEKARKEINDEILSEKFEEILFELAQKLVLTEDEKLTIQYPFLVRIGDVIEHKENTLGHVKSTVIDRSYLKRGDEAVMKVKLNDLETGEEWETEFELPE